MENKELIELITKYPNDMELGKEVRKLIESNEIVSELKTKFPNDMELGKEIRKII